MSTAETLTPVLRPFAAGVDGSAAPLGFSFFCPGCQQAHAVWVRRREDGIPGPVWDWNGSVQRPTFTPSVLVRGCNYPENGTPEDQAEYDRLIRDRDAIFASRFGTRCHSFVADGVIDFLDDCTHALRGKHPLPAHPRATQDAA